MSQQKQCLECGKIFQHRTAKYCCRKCSSTAIGRNRTCTIHKLKQENEQLLERIAKAENMLEAYDYTARMNLKLNEENEKILLEINEIKCICGIPNQDKLKKHNLTNRLPDLVRYQILERVVQNRNAENRYLKEQSEKELAENNFLEMEKFYKVEVKKLREQNEQLRQALRKCSPCDGCHEYICNFCENPVKHKPVCEYLRLIGGNENES